jgi:hypothetical protein
VMGSLKGSAPAKATVETGDPVTLVDPDEPPQEIK